MISIVIPALNEEKLLPDCLGSLRKQEYSGEYEIIVADNGSRDRTADIARSFGVKVIDCSEKKSVFVARQMGADAARGDIIAQADADTVYPPDWLRRISERFAAHPETVAITGRFAYIDRPWWWPFEYSVRHMVNWFTGKFSGKPLLVSGATFAFRRQAFYAGGGYRGLSYAPDQYGLVERLSRLGKIEYDSGLRVLTSARTVRKPLLVIAQDIAAHAHNFANRGVEPGSGRQVRVRRSSRQIAARLLPVPLAVILLVGVHGCIVPSSQVFGQVYYEGVASDRVVALTFDDGLDEAYTSEILDVLDRYGVRGTFFLSGENVELYPDVARRIVSEGHVIGNQSYYHDTLHIITQYSSDDIETTQDVIFDATGVYPHLFRPPHGTKNPWELGSAAEMNMLPITWGASLDASVSRDDIREIASEVEPGEIIRLHDDEERSGAEYPIAGLLPQIIEQLSAKGYRFVTVSQLLDVPAYNQADR